MASASRPRDSQRSKVYAWEREQVEPDMKAERIQDIDEIRELVDRILADHGLRWIEDGGRKPADGSQWFYTWKRHLVYWKHGSRGGRYNMGGWCGFKVIGTTGVPLFQLLKVGPDVELILHEVAHLIIDQTYGVRRLEGHGGTFVRALIELLDRYSEAWKGRANELIESARAAGIAVSSSPAIAQRYRERMAEELPPAPKPTRTRVRSTCTESPGAIVRRIARANPTLAFAEIVKLAVAEGVNPNTARGALVRFKAQQRQESDDA